MISVQILTWRCWGWGCNLLHYDPKTANNAVNVGWRRWECKSEPNGCGDGGVETYSGGGVSATSNGAEVHGDFVGEGRGWCELIFKIEKTNITPPAATGPQEYDVTLHVTHSKLVACFQAEKYIYFHRPHSHHLETPTFTSKQIKGFDGDHHGQWCCIRNLSIFEWFWYTHFLFSLGHRIYI